MVMSANRCRCCCFEFWAACSCRDGDGGSWFGVGAGWGSCCRVESSGGPPRAAPPSGPNGRRSFCRRARTRTSAWTIQPRSCCTTGSEALRARTLLPSRSICGSLASAQWHPENETSIRDAELLPNRRNHLPPPPIWSEKQKSGNSPANWCKLIDRPSNSVGHAQTPPAGHQVSVRKDQFREFLKFQTNFWH